MAARAAGSAAGRSAVASLARPGASLRRPLLCTELGGTRHRAGGHQGSEGKELGSGHGILGGCAAVWPLGRGGSGLMTVDSAAAEPFSRRS